MRFHLHMSGDGIGTLSVWRRSQGGLHPLLTLTGDQGNYWQMREIPLSDVADFQVVFEGQVGRSPKGDICLDDITFSPGCLLAPDSSGQALSTFPASAGLHSLISVFLQFLFSKTLALLIHTEFAISLPNIVGVCCHFSQM